MGVPLDRVSAPGPSVCYTWVVVAVLTESACKHGFQEEDFYEVLEAGPLKLRSKRGLEGVYELYGRNYAGEYLHIAYRREAGRDVVFHIRAMSPREKQWYRKNR
jgi:hypothetical protein